MWCGSARAPATGTSSVAASAEAPRPSRESDWRGPREGVVRRLTRGAGSLQTPSVGDREVGEALRFEPLPTDHCGRKTTDPDDEVIDLFRIERRNLLVASQRRKGIRRKSTMARSAGRNPFSRASCSRAFRPLAKALASAARERRFSLATARSLRLCVASTTAPDSPPRRRRRPDRRPRHPPRKSSRSLPGARKRAQNVKAPSQTTVRERATRRARRRPSEAPGIEPGAEYLRAPPDMKGEIIEDCKTAYSRHSSAVESSFRAELLQEQRSAGQVVLDHAARVRLPHVRGGLSTDRCG